MSERAALQSGVLLFAAVAAAWAALLAMGAEMPMGAGLWLVAWTAMMAAMMLPSATPLVTLYYRRSPRLAHAALLTAGYLLAWTAVGVVAYVVAMRIPEPGDAVVAGVLVAVGVYQLTPLKTACLRHCRSPLDFVITHWRKGGLGALRLGAEHGAYCIGCCWALMAVLVVVGSMGLVWVIAIAAAVTAEKLLPAGFLLGRLGGVGLIAAGAFVAL